jgi:hypothetical protein
MVRAIARYPAAGFGPHLLFRKVLFRKALLRKTLFRKTPRSGTDREPPTTRVTARPTPRMARPSPSRAAALAASKSSQVQNHTQLQNPPATSKSPPGQELGAREAPDPRLRLGGWPLGLWFRPGTDRDPGPVTNRIRPSTSFRNPGQAFASPRRRPAAAEPRSFTIQPPGPTGSHWEPLGAQEPPVGALDFRVPAEPGAI